MLSSDGYAEAKSLAAWKAAVADRWDSIEIKSLEVGDGLNATIEAGRDYEVTIVVDEKGLDDAIGVEFVTVHNENGRERIYSVTPFEMLQREGTLYTFRAKIGVSNAGSFKLAFRMYPKNDKLPHRQDFCYVRWF